MSLEIITRPTCPYSSDYIWDQATKGFTEKFRPKRTRGSVVARRTVSVHKRLTSDPKVLERFNNRPGKALWDWQGRCTICQCVRENELLAPNGGLCESCHKACHKAQETDHGNTRPDSERPGQAA
jgi:hypothetical protein